MPDVIFPSHNAVGSSSSDLGRGQTLTESDLERAYRSTVDPRLNYEKALEVAMLIVRKQAQLGKPA